ncbi:1942_t:CDS:2 [Gigaspora rosea]|nr:1942_t:CDS:2 [Gigaspora rosea]
MSSEPKGLAQDIDLHIKVYIDDAYQATITTLVDKVKELINQQAENQKRWNEQIQRTINDRFNKLEQVETRDDQGNYPPISVIYDMLIDPTSPKHAKKSCQS